MKNKNKLTIDREQNFKAPGWAGLYPPDVFQALLRHERCRSDREGSVFSLAVFDVSGMNSNGRDIKRVTGSIKEKMRTIDEVGWIDPKSIGVLLPVTSAEGGQQFAHRVGEPIPCSIYTYPGHWLPGSDENTREGTPRSGGTEDAVKRVFCRTIPFWKKCLDRVGSLLLIILLSPLFLLMFVYIKMVSPGKVIFRQKRVGYHGKTFTFIKFRTMHENNDPIAHQEYYKELIRSGQPMEKLDGERDPRIIPGGKWIRKMCIDELPQLINVLRGDMSLVGPRPCIPYEAAEYLRWHAHRFDTLPGMTGLWQVSGKNKLSFEQMVRLDITYANRMSLLFDVKILLLTLPAIAKMVMEAGVKRIRHRFSGSESVNMIKGGEERALRDA
jgi:lipopolysaccharide/colanic/teichoic acid biosynthesis glycosyltransferase